MKKILILTLLLVPFLSVNAMTYINSNGTWHTDYPCTDQGTHLAGPITYGSAGGKIYARSVALQGTFPNCIENPVADVEQVALPTPIQTPIVVASVQDDSAQIQ